MVDTEAGVMQATKYQASPGTTRGQKKRHRTGTPEGTHPVDVELGGLFFRTVRITSRILNH
jgi:hypothetical protein